MTLTQDDTLTIAPPKPRAPRVAPPEPSRRSFNPDGRWYHPLVGMMWLYALAGVPHWTGVSSWALAPVGVAMTIAVRAGAKKRYHAAHHGINLQKNVTALITAGGLFATMWLVWAGAAVPAPPLLTSYPAVGVLLFGSLGVGAFYAVFATEAPELEDAKRERNAEQRAEMLDEKTRREADEWESILTDSACPGMTVEALAVTEGGWTLELVDSPTKPIKLTGLVEACSTIAAVAAPRLARKGINLRNGKVTAEPGDAAHRLRLHISTTNRFEQSIPFDMNQPVDSITNKQTIAYYEDGTTADLDLYGIHGVMVGATGSGKDVLTNNIIARVSRCNDQLLWVGGSDKLSPLVWSWLLPWLQGRVERPIINRLAGEDPLEVLKMLADLLQAVKVQNKRLGPGGTARKPTPQDPGITCIITEASDLLIDHSQAKVKCFDGVWRNGSQLINAIDRSGRSAGYSTFLTSQYGLMDALGAHGTYAKRNITLRIAGKTYSYHDGAQTLVGIRNVDTTKLTDFTLMIQPSNEAPRAMAAKAAVLDTEEQIAPVAARNAGNVPAGLPEWITSQLLYHEGAWDAERLPDLAELAEANGYKWPSTDRPRSVTVGDSARGLPTPREEETRAMTATQYMQEGRELMAHAREQIAKHGPLGETMSLVLDAALAADSPDFLPVAPLAIVTGLSPKGGDTKVGEERLLRELPGKPWNLPAVEHAGKRGWWKQDVVTRVREFLTGEPTSPALPAGEDTVALLTAIVESGLGLSGESVKSAELLTVAADKLGWPANTEGARRVADALRPIGVEAFRPSSGDRAMSYPADKLRDALRRSAN